MFCKSSVYNRIGRDLNPSFNLRDAFSKPDLLRLPGMVDGLIKGLTRDSMQQFDKGFSEDVSFTSITTISSTCLCSSSR